jgi:hypothetical protein
VWPGSNKEAEAWMTGKCTNQEKGKRRRWLDMDRRAERSLSDGRRQPGMAGLDTTGSFDEDAEFMQMPCGGIPERATKQGFKVEVTV